MRDVWDVIIDDELYHIDLISKKSVEVNGRTLKLKNFKKKIGLLTREFEVPIGPKKGTIIWKKVGTSQLIIDGKDCATGEKVVPVKTPGWAYIFVVLHFINVINGSNGWKMAIVGIALTFAIARNSSINLAIRVGLCSVLLLLILFVAFSITFILSLE